MVCNNTYLKNKFSTAQGDQLREWSKLGKPTDNDEWAMTSTTVNAYYDPSANEIVFPAGILRPPMLYDPSLPKYLSYGALGTVSSHELSHAFDSQGSRYDQNRGYNEWWSNPTRQACESKVLCFTNQYSQYSVDGPVGRLQVNGKLTLGENIAVTGGVNAVYQA